MGNKAWEETVIDALLPHGIAAIGWTAAGKECRGEDPLGNIWRRVARDDGAQFQTTLESDTRTNVHLPVILRTDSELVVIGLKVEAYLSAGTHRSQVGALGVQAREGEQVERLLRMLARMR